MGVSHKPYAIDDAVVLDAGRVPFAPLIGSIAFLAEACRVPRRAQGDPQLWAYRILADLHTVSMNLQRPLRYGDIAGENCAVLVEVDRARLLAVAFDRHRLAAIGTFGLGCATAQEHRHDDESPGDVGRRNVPELKSTAVSGHPLNDRGWHGVWQPGKEWLIVRSEAIAFSGAEERSLATVW